MTRARRTVMSGRRWAGGLVALVALLLLAGCGGRVLSAGEVSVLVGARADSGMEALASGGLAVVGGCLGLEDFVVVWPHGTDVVEADPLRVEVPGVGTVGLGDRVELGGGFVVEHPGDAPAQHPEPLTVGGADVPRSCARHDVFLAH